MLTIINLKSVFCNVGSSSESWNFSSKSTIVMCDQIPEALIAFAFWPVLGESLTISATSRYACLGHTHCFLGIVQFTVHTTVSCDESKCEQCSLSGKGLIHLEI